MADLPISIRYVLMCDDLRTEDNGKAIIVGLYNDAIVMAAGAIQFTAPLTFVINALVPANRPTSVSTWLEAPDGSRRDEHDWGVVQSPPDPHNDPTNIVWRIFPWSSRGLGRFKLHMSQDGEDRVIYEFDVRSS